MTLKQLFEAVTSPIVSFFKMMMQVFSSIFSEPTTSTPSSNNYYLSPAPHQDPPFSPQKQTDVITPTPFFQAEKVSVIDMKFSESFNSALRTTLYDGFKNNLQTGESIYVNCLWLTTRLDHYLIPEIKTHMDKDNRYFLLIIAQDKEDKEASRLKEEVGQAFKTDQDRIIVIPLRITGVIELKEELSEKYEQYIQESLHAKGISKESISKASAHLS